MSYLFLKPLLLNESTNIEPGESRVDPPDNTSASPAVLTLAEALDRIRVPRPAFVPASALAHHSDPDELALDMLSRFDRLDFRCPDIQALVVSTIGSCYGDVLAERLAPTPNVPVPKPKLLPRKRQPKGKQPQLASLFTLFPPND